MKLFAMTNSKSHSNKPKTINSNLKINSNDKKALNQNNNNNISRTNRKYRNQIRKLLDSLQTAKSKEKQKINAKKTSTDVPNIKQNRSKFMTEK